MTKIFSLIIFIFFFFPLIFGQFWQQSSNWQHSSSSYDRCCFCCCYCPVPSNQVQQQANNENIPWQQYQGDKFSPIKGYGQSQQMVSHTKKPEGQVIQIIPRENC